MRNCCVPNCKDKWNKIELRKKYHIFPKEQWLTEQWISVLALRREPSKHANVCSDHFKMSDYNITNYGDFTGLLKKGTIPSQNLPNSKGTSSHDVAKFPTDRRTRVTFTLLLIEFVAIKEEPVEEMVEERDVPMEINSSEEKTSSPVNLTMKDASMTARPEVRSFGMQTSFVNLRITYNTITDTELIYATGLERKRFHLIFYTLEKYLPIPEITVCVKKGSLLVTLFILRHSSNLRMAEFIFGLSRRILSGVFQDVVDKLHCLLKREDIWDKSFRDSKQFRFLLESIEKYQNRKKIMVESEIPDNNQC